MVAGSLEETAALVRSYACDVVVVTADDIAEAPADFDALGLGPSAPLRAVVLHEKGHAHPGAVQHNESVIVVPYAPGHEEQVIDAVIDSQVDILAESEA